MTSCLGVRTRFMADRNSLPWPSSPPAQPVCHGEDPVEETQEGHKHGQEGAGHVGQDLPGQRNR